MLFTYLFQQDYFCYYIFKYQVTICFEYSTSLGGAKAILKKKLAESLEILLLLFYMLVTCSFLLSGRYKDNRARRCELRRRSAPAAEPVVERQASRACKRGPQHTVGARGHTKTGQTLIVPSLQNT